MIKSNDIDLDSKDNVVQSAFTIIMKTFIAIIEASRNIRFRYQKNLLYYINNNKNDYKRLCILKFIKFEIFKQIHDYMYYDKFHRTYN